MANRQENEAVRRFDATQKEAEQGHADAQYNLGEMYRKGEGEPQDDAKAAKWFWKAAEQGHADAQFRLGCMYSEGEGVLAEDDAEAAKWFGKAAEQGHAEAQFRLGCMYSDGEGVLLTDYVESAKWMRKAAEQGHADAQFNVGRRYYFGEGVQKDYVEAYAWFLFAKPNGEEAAGKMISRLEKRLTAEQKEKGRERAAELHRLYGAK